MRLVDRLRGTDVAQLGRTISGARDERHAREIRLDDRSMQMCGCRPARGQHDSGTSRLEADTQCAEPGHTFVVRDMNAEFAPRVQRNRQRCRSRARRDDGLCHTAAHPFVDERGAERRLGGLHPPIFVEG